MTDAVRLTGVYIGSSQPMPNDGRPTGIFKQAIAGPVRVTREGLQGDVQADRRVHGGPEKAVHQFSVENYALLAAHFPDRASAFVPGTLGENLSSPQLHERNIHIGDVFAVGTVRLQVAQPRTPCWKIDARFGFEGITERVAHFGIAGWYYRVLEEGELQQGDILELIERDEQAPSLEQFHQLTASHRPPPEALERLAAIPALTPDWAVKLRRRAAYLRQLTDASQGTAS